MQKALQYLKRQILVPGFSGVDKEGQGGSSAPPPIELKDHPFEKMKFEEKLRGGAITMSWSQYQSYLLITYCKLPIKVLVLCLRTQLKSNFGALI